MLGLKYSIFLGEGRQVTLAAKIQSEDLPGATGKALCDGGQLCAQSALLRSSAAAFCGTGYSPAGLQEQSICLCYGWFEQMWRIIPA